MTLVAAWARKAGKSRELVVASDSRTERGLVTNLTSCSS